MSTGRIPVPMDKLTESLFNSAVLQDASLHRRLQCVIGADTCLVSRRASRVRQSRYEALKLCRVCISKRQLSIRQGGRR